MKINLRPVLGNDLVDLKQASLDSNWQRKGYLDKIYTGEEQELILHDVEPSTMLWLLWTMKEASYKLINRLTSVRNFAPLSFKCSHPAISGTAVTGVVRTDTITILIKADITEEMVHSVAVQKKEMLDELKIAYIRDSTCYMDDFNRNCVGYLLSKDSAGLPQVTHLSSSITGAASVSHHGRYTAILYGVPAC